jgi:hypothetical protein
MAMFKKIIFSLLATTSILSASSKLSVEALVFENNAERIIRAMKDPPLSEKEAQEEQKKLYKRDMQSMAVVSKKALAIVYNLPQLGNESGGFGFF